jgi:hypothetical protein
MPLDEGGEVPIRRSRLDHPLRIALRTPRRPTFDQDVRFLPPSASWIDVMSLV